MRMTVKVALAVTTLSILRPWAPVCTHAGPLGSSTAADLQRLQGSWEGVLEGHETEGKISIRIAGNSLHFRGLKPDQRYSASFTLPPGTDPQQLHATITDGPAPSAIGTVVFAILKIENATLTLAGISASAAQSPRPLGQDSGFEDNSMFRYDLRRVQPNQSHAGPPL